MIRKKAFTVKGKLIWGIDNGVSGTIGARYEGRSWLFSTPIKNELKYTKVKAYINRIDHFELKHQMKKIVRECNPESMLCLIERPMVNPKAFTATLSAIRALEATLIVLELLELPLEYIDSKEWQKELLPKGIKGRANLKRASADIGKRMYPQFAEEIEKHGDADGLLMAEYGRRYY